MMILDSGSLFLGHPVYNVYFSTSTFKYAILMQKVKYVPAHRVHFVWSQHSSCGVRRFGGIWPQFRTPQHPRFKSAHFPTRIHRQCSRNTNMLARRHAPPLALLNTPTATAPLPLVGLSVYLDFKGMGPTVM